MKYFIILLYLLHYLSDLLTVDSACFYWCCKCGSLDKKNTPYLFVGEYLSLTCTLNQTTVENGDNSSKLFFSFGSSTEISENETVIVDEYSLRLNKLMSSLEYDSAYYCKLRGQLPALPPIVSYIQVEVEEPPHTITNFECIIHDWNESMVCTWDLGVKYQHMKVINTSLFMEDGHCPKMQKTNCTWNKSDGILDDRSFYNFTVVVTNTRRGVSTYTENLIISPIDNVKPSKVEYFAVHSVTSTCVTLEWRHLKENRTKEFIINTASKWNDTENYTTSSPNITICKLKPYTRYNFSIEVRPGNDEGYYSDKEFNFTHTLKDKPSYPPVIVGNYVHDEDCMNNLRTITINWKKVPEKDQNGPMIGYFIAVNSSDGGSYSPYYINDTNLLHYSVMLPCDQEMKVSLQSWGEVGLSTLSSTITVDEATYLKKSDIVLISLGAIFLLILITVGVVSIIRWLVPRCKKIQKPFYIETIQMAKPDIKQNYIPLSAELNVNGSVFHTNQDSGHYSDSDTFYKNREKDNVQIQKLYNNKDSYNNGFQSDSITATTVTSCSNIKEAHSIEKGEQVSPTISCESLSSLPHHEKLFLNISDEDEDGYIGESDDNLVSYVVHGNNDSSSSSTN